jgi:hypothetical protein
MVPLRSARFCQGRGSWSSGKIIEVGLGSESWEVRGQVEECNLRGCGFLVLEENLRLPFIQGMDNSLL